MWSPHQFPPPIEKIRKSRWTPENTKKTQEVVNALLVTIDALRLVLPATRCTAAMAEAVDRFKKLDPGVKT